MNKPTKKVCLMCNLMSETARAIALQRTDGRLPAHLCLDCRAVMENKPKRKSERRCRKCNGKLPAARYYDCEECVPELESDPGDETYAA